MRWVVLLYGSLAYLTFLFSFAALGAFAINPSLTLGVSLRGIDTVPTGSWLVDVLLIALFGVTHSVLARPSVKRALALPRVIERSTYVLVASLCLLVLVWQWRALPEVVWAVPGAARYVVWALHGAGIATLLYSTFLTDHFDLFGMRQVWLHFRGTPYTEVPFVEHSLYRYVRHPMMLGVLVWLWAVPTMTVGHLVLSLGMSAYTLVGIVFEERGLERELGAPYVDYTRRVRALVPLRRGR